MLEFYTFGERPDLVSRWAERRDPWAGMEWMYHDPICEHYWPNLSHDFADFQFLVYDVERDSILGEGWTIPFRWSGRASRANHRTYFQPQKSCSEVAEGVVCDSRPRCPATSQRGGRGTPGGIRTPDLPVRSRTL